MAKFQKGADYFSPQDLPFDRLICKLGILDCAINEFFVILTAVGSSSIVAYPYRARGMFASIEICHTQHHRAKLSPRQRLLLQDPVTKCQPVFKMIVKPYSNLPCPYWALKGECHALELLKIGSTNCYSIRKKCCVKSNYCHQKF